MPSSKNWKAFFIRNFFYLGAGARTWKKLSGSRARFAINGKSIALLPVIFS